MPLPNKPRHTVGSDYSPEGTLKQFGFSSEEVANLRKNQKRLNGIPSYAITIEHLEKTLNRDMGGEGYTFQIADTDLDNGFVRVMVKAPGSTLPESYLDLRVGGDTPFGPSFHMQVTKGSMDASTFGIPAFPRLVGDRMRSTLSTLEDFIRAYHDKAREKGKSPQETIWTTYQEGDPTYNLPGSGVALTPSSSSGQIGYQERIVRYSVPENYPGRSDVDQQQRFVKSTMAKIARGELPALRGYVTEPNQWNAFVPGTNFVWKETTAGISRFVAQTRRGVGSEFKSQSTVREARMLAQQPFVWDSETNKMVAITPEPAERKARRGGPGGARTGFVRSSVILPGESAPRNVLVQRMALADQPDMPGAAYASPSAFQVQTSKGRKPIYAFGEEMNALAELNITNANQLLDILRRKDGGLEVDKVAGYVLHEGKGKGEIGRIYGEGSHTEYLDTRGRLHKTQKKDNWEPVDVTNYTPILMDRRGYDVLMGDPVIHIPAYYDTKTGDFSNLPGEGFSSTDELQELLRQKMNLRVAGYSSIGIQGKENPAEMYMVMQTYGLNPNAIKTAGFKAGITLTQQLYLNMMGVNGQQTVDLLTQEAKIPSAVLMGAFGIMNPKTQYKFLREFASGNPKDETEAKKINAVIGWMQKQYAKKDFNGIDLERLAYVFETAGGKLEEKDYFTADIMFANMFNRILDVNDPKKAASMWRNYGIGLPDTQMVAGVTYSKEEKEVMENLAKEHPTAGKNLEFERIEGTERELYRLKFQVNQGRSVVLPAALSMTPEYQSNSGYIGFKSIMSMADSFPMIAKSMGLLSAIPDNPLVMGSSGPNMLDQPEKAEVVPSRQGWFDLWTWAGFQRDLNELNPSIPAGTIQLTPALANEIRDALIESSRGETSKDRLDIFEQNLRKINKSDFNLEQNIDLADSFFVDPLGTLVPKLSSIKSVESYREGLRAGQTRTYIGDTYLRLFRAAVVGASSDPTVSYGNVMETRDRFYRRISNQFEAKEKGGSKHIFRNIIGSNLPGTRGGRYMALGGLQVMEAAADEDYIRAMLSNGRFVSPDKIKQIMRYLDEGEDAYLPVLTQRFPDVSGSSTWIPMKLRSLKWLKKQGLDYISEGKLGTRGVFFMSQTANRFFIGDFDNDPAMQKLLPLFDLDPLKGEKELHRFGVADDAAREEFERSIAGYNDVGARLNTVLTKMFGKRGTSWQESLDAERKNLNDYAEAVGSGRGSLRDRLGKVGVTSLTELMAAAMRVKHSKGGMGASYNRRTLTEDIADMVLTHGGSSGDESIREKAYESGAFAYQMYLDREKIAAGDFSPLETALNSIGIYGYENLGSQGVQYAVNYMLSNQGKETPFDISYKPDDKDQKNWTSDVFKAGYPGNQSILSSLISQVSKDPNMSNAQLAWGFGMEGHRESIFNELENANIEDREGILKHFMRGEEKVGLRSPFYLSAIYNIVQRAIKKDPQLLSDSRVKLPWINGELLSLSEIANTDEYKLEDIGRRIAIDKNGILRPEELELLNNMGKTRFGRHMVGIYREYRTTSGMEAGTTGEAQQFSETLASSYDRIQRIAMSRPPLVHASELGALAYKNESEWRAPYERIQDLEQYKTIARFMGIPQLFGDREYQKRVMFTPTTYEHVDEQIGDITDIEKGNRFEKAFAQLGIFHHIGQVSRETPEGFDISPVNEKNLTFDVGGLTITGVPDFVDYDEKEDKVIIRDTKLAKDDPATNQAVRNRVASYKNRTQQIGYAYGLEKNANALTQDQWIEFLKGWGFTDEKKMIAMKKAASAGRFSVALLPGNAIGPEIQTYDRIDIPYGPAEKGEYERLATRVKDVIFGEENIRKVAQDIWHAVQSGGLPSTLTGISRTSWKPEKSYTNILEQFAKERWASGVIRNEEPVQMRVGEGGPEDIEISNGQIKVIPEHHGWRPGFGQPRFAGGGEEEEFNTGKAVLPPDPETKKRRKSRQPAPAPVPEPVQEKPAASRMPEISGDANMWGDMIKASSETIATTLANAIGNPVIKLVGGSKMASLSELSTKIAKMDFNTTEFLRNAESYQGNIRETLLGVFDRAGKGDLVKNLRTGYTGYDLLSLAQQTFAPEEYQPYLSANVPESGPLSKQAASFKGIFDFMTMVGRGNENFQAALDFFPKEIQDKFTKIAAELSGQNVPAKGETLDLSGKKGKISRPGELITSTWELSSILSQGGTISPDLAPGKFSKVEPEYIQRWLNSVAKLAEASDKVAESHGNLYEVNKALLAEQKLNLQMQIDASEVAKRAAVKLGGSRVFTEEGKLRPESEREGIAYNKNEQASMVQFQAAERSQIRAEKELEELGSTSGIQKMARGFLGGWGLMYLNTLSSYGTDQWAQGYQQYEKVQDIAARVAGQIGGPGAGIGDRTEQQYQNALAYGGNIPYRQMRRDEARWISSGLGDVGAAFAKGVGAGGIALFAGNLMAETGGPILGTAGSYLARSAVPILAAATIGSLIYDQYSYAANAQDTGVAVAINKLAAERYAEEGRSGLDVAAQNVGAWWKSLSAKNAPAGTGIQSLTALNGDLDKITPWKRISLGDGSPINYYNVDTNQLVSESALTGEEKTAANLAPTYTLPAPKASKDQTIYELSASIGALDYYTGEEVGNFIKSGNYKKETVSNFTYGDIYKMISEKVQSQGSLKGITPEDILPVLQTIAGGFEGISPEIAYKTTGMMLEAGNFEPETAKKIMKGYTQGLNYDVVAQQLASFGRGVPTNAVLSPIVAGLANGSYGQDKLTELSAYMQFLQNLPEEGFEISASKNVFEMVAKIYDIVKTKGYENIVGTTKEQPVLSALVSSETARGFGIKTTDLDTLIHQAKLLPKEQALTTEQLAELQTASTYASGQVSYWQQARASAMDRGMSSFQASEMAKQLAPYGTKGKAWYSGLLSGDSQFYTALAASGVDLTQIKATDAFGRATTLNDLAVSDIGLNGQITGQSLYTTSLRRGSLSAQTVAEQVFGANWQANDKYGVKAGAVNGGTFEQYGVTEPVGGMRYLQYRQMQASEEYRKAQQGNSYAQLALSGAFQTGVGIGNYNPINPQTGKPFGFNTGQFGFNVAGVGGYTSTGGGYWGLEDAQRALQTLQSQWGFDYSQRQMTLQANQFYENTGLQRRNQTMQRGFTASDWAYQDQTRQLQRQWQLEDYAESSRFMTGRERRLAERQMGRQNIMYGLEGDQISRQRDQQKEVWKIEDEQYRLQIKHFEETRRMQEEANRVNRAFYEEQRRLIEESTAMQRAYWTEQQKLQQSALAASNKYSNEIADINNTQELLSISASDATAQSKLMTIALDFATTAMGEFYEMLEKTAELAGSKEAAEKNKHQEGDSAGTNLWWHWDGSQWVKKTGAAPRAMGGPAMAGQRVIIGDTNEPEFFTSSESGTIVPLSKVNPWLNNISFADSGSSAPVVMQSKITLYVGDKYLGEFIIDTVDKELHL